MENMNIPWFQRSCSPFNLPFLLVINSIWCCETLLRFHPKDALTLTRPQVRNGSCDQPICNMFFFFNGKIEEHHDTSLMKHHWLILVSNSWKKIDVHISFSKDSTCRKNVFLRQVDLPVTWCSLGPMMPWPGESAQGALSSPHRGWLSHRNQSSLSWAAFLGCRACCCRKCLGMSWDVLGCWGNRCII